MAQIAVSESEVADWQPKINGIVEWFGQLQQVDVSQAPPAVHANEGGRSPLRADEPRLHPARAELLAQAPSLERTYIRVPKIGTGADAEAAAAAPAAATATATAAAATAAAATAAAAGPAATPAAAPAAAAAAAGAAAPAAAAAAGAPSAADLQSLFSMDIRVGKVVSCEPHPEADSLYVEKVDVGEPELRTIVSGLVKYVPLEQMQGRMCVFVCNLKPRNMRGIKSVGMLLAASNEPEKTMVEPLAPPEGSKPGERVWFGEHKDQPAPLAANSVEKKKLWEVVQPGLRTQAGDSCAVAWRGLPMMTSSGPVCAATLQNARVA